MLLNIISYNENLYIWTLEYLSNFASAEAIIKAGYKVVKGANSFSVYSEYTDDFLATFENN
jgi:hypothetical protein